MKFLIHENGQVVEKCADSADDLGLKYICFISSGTENAARERVCPGTAVGLFESLAQSTDKNKVPAICGYGIYRA